MDRNLIQAKNPNLEEETIKKKREANAKNLIYLFTDTRSNWLKNELIRQLYFYMDFDFVKFELFKIYKSPLTSIKIRKTIKQLHDGTLDVTDLLEQIKRNEESYREYLELKNNIKSEKLLENTEAPNLDQDYLKLLKAKLI